MQPILCEATRSRLSRADWVAERIAFEAELVALGVPFRVLVRTNRSRLELWLAVLRAV